MIVNILQIILRFIVLVALQVLILNNIQLGGIVNPYLYVLFLLTLPVQTPKVLLLFVGFILGISIDLFQNSTGIHAFACVLIAFIRPSWLKLVAPRDGFEPDESPEIRKFGFRWFLVYASVLVFVHHFVIFNLEIFRFSDFWSTQLRVLYSSIFTLVLIILSQYLLYKPEK